MNLSPVTSSLDIFDKIETLSKDPLILKYSLQKSEIVSFVDFL